MSRTEFIAFRKTLGRTPPLVSTTVRTRGLSFKVWTSPHVGDAVPLLLVNGGLLYAHSLLWPALSPLAERRQVILYDQRGRGESEAPANTRSARIEDDADDVGAIRRALGIRRWDVLGHSWGGGIAMLAIARDIGATRRLVTVNAVGPTNDWMAALHATTLERVSGDARATLVRLYESATKTDDPALQSAYARAAYPAWFADSSFASYFTPPEDASETGAAILGRLRREGYDWRNQIKTITTPTLVLHGDRDALPPTISEELAQLLPKARSIIIPNAGHMPFWEVPQLFFEQVSAFLDT